MLFAPTSLFHLLTCATNSSVTSCSAGIGFSSLSPPHDISKKPFIVKFKTNQIKVCQGCRQNCEGQNDAMGLVVARAERRLVSNLVTGSQFLGRESNSHYHLSMQCLRKADSTFMSKDLVIPEEVISKVSSMQKMYLATFLMLYMYKLYVRSRSYVAMWYAIHTFYY